MAGDGAAVALVVAETATRLQSLAAYYEIAVAAQQEEIHRLTEELQWHEAHRPEDAMAQWKRMYERLQAICGENARTISDLEAEHRRVLAELAAEHEAGRRMFTDYERLLNAAYDERDQARREIKQLRGAMEYEEHNGQRLMAAVEDHKVEIERLTTLLALHDGELEQHIAIEQQQAAEIERLLLAGQSTYSAGFEAGRGYPNAVVIPDA